MLFFLYVAAFFVVIAAWFAILSTGRFPRGMFDVTDRYPPFRLSP